jgi:hypothetical protein
VTVRTKVPGVVMLKCDYVIQVLKPHNFKRQSERADIRVTPGRVEVDPAHPETIVWHP